jgi:hypothetical protein
MQRYLLIATPTGTAAANADPNELPANIKNFDVWSDMVAACCRVVSMKKIAGWRECH